MPSAVRALRGATTLDVDKKTLDHLRKEAKPELVATLVTKMLNKADTTAKK